MNDAIFSNVAAIRLAAAFNLPFTDDAGAGLSSTRQPSRRDDALAGPGRGLASTPPFLYKFD